MGLMYAWATPEKCLDELTLSQLIMFHRKGWEAKQTESRVNWGILGMLLNGEDPEKEKSDLGLEEIQRYYPDAYMKDGKVVIPR